MSTHHTSKRLFSYTFLKKINMLWIYEYMYVCQRINYYLLIRYLLHPLLSISLSRLSKLGWLGKLLGLGLGLGLGLAVWLGLHVLLIRLSKLSWLTILLGLGLAVWLRVWVLDERNTVAGVCTWVLWLLRSIDSDFDLVFGSNIGVDGSVDDGGVVDFQDTLPFFSSAELVPDSQTNKKDEFNQE